MNETFEDVLKARLILAAKEIDELKAKLATVMAENDRSRADWTKAIQANVEVAKINAGLVERLEAAKKLAEADERYDWCREYSKGTAEAQIAIMDARDARKIALVNFKKAGEG